MLSRNALPQNACNLGQQFAPLLVQSGARPADFDSRRDAPTNNPDAAELLKLLNDDFSADRNQRLKQFALTRDAARDFYFCDFDDVMNLENESADTRAAYGDDRLGEPLCWRGDSSSGVFRLSASTFPSHGMFATTSLARCGRTCYPRWTEALPR